MSDLVPEEAIEAGAMALTEVTKRPWADTLPGARDVLRRNARLSVTAAAPLILAANPAKLTGADRVSLGEALHALGLLDDEDLSDVTMRAAQWFDEWLAGRASVLRGEGDRDG